MNQNHNQPHTQSQTNIPILIVCYNNYKYVDSTIKQLTKINPQYESCIQVINNSSTEENTINYLNSLTNIPVMTIENRGPWIDWHRNIDIYNALPEKYVLTDPDLGYNPKLPSNFIEIMANLSDHYQCYKIGFSIDIQNFDSMYTYQEYMYGMNIYDWENRYWQSRIENPLFELYAAPIDTTFALINKKFVNDHHIRIAGDFTCLHYPFYKKDAIMSIYDKYDYIQRVVYDISTMKQFWLRDIEENYLKIEKNKELLFLEKKSLDTHEIIFWKETFSSWKPELFILLDTCSSKSKDVYIFGDTDGKVSLYASKKSRNVIVHEISETQSNKIMQNDQHNMRNIIIDSNVSNSFDDAIQQIHDNHQDISFIYVDVDLKGKEADYIQEWITIRNLYKIPIYINNNIWENKENVSNILKPLITEGQYGVVKNKNIYICLG